MLYLWWFGPATLSTSSLLNRAKYAESLVFPKIIRNGSNLYLVPFETYSIKMRNSDLHSLYVPKFIVSPSKLILKLINYDPARKIFLDDS